MSQIGFRTLLFGLIMTSTGTSSTEARTAGTSFVRPINLYIRSSESAAGNGNAWLHCGAALLTLQYPNAANRSSNQGWVTLHSHGSGRIAGVFSVFFGMQVVRFNDSVLCTTIQTQANGPRFVTYSFQVRTNLMPRSNSLTRLISVRQWNKRVN